MKKIILAVLMLLTIALSGCARGEITLNVSRWGAADVNCKLVTCTGFNRCFRFFSK